MLFEYVSGKAIGVYPGGPLGIGEQVYLPVGLLERLHDLPLVKKVSPRRNGVNVILDETLPLAHNPRVFPC